MRPPSHWAHFWSSEPALALPQRGYFADTWAGKYENLSLALNLLSSGGLYVIDDMDPQPTWPAGHETRVMALLDDLAARHELRITKLSWASGIVIAARV